MRMGNWYRRLHVEMGKQEKILLTIFLHTKNVPMTIPYHKRLVITGESYIHNDDFEKLRMTLLDSNGKPYRNSRNLAAGSVRNLNPAKGCQALCLFYRV